MKTFLTIILTSLIGTISAQTINNVPITEIDAEYMRIIGYAKLMSNKVKVSLDFGQRNSVWTGKDDIIKDENGKNVVFNSMIDALNFMAENKYEYVNSYGVINSNNQVIDFIILRKI